MNRYEELLLKLISEDNRFFVLTAENRAALRNLPELIENNFIDTGIAEMSLVGISAGLALRGRIPIVHSLASFLTMRAFEFIRTDVGFPKLPVKLIGSFAGFLSTANGPTHQAIEDIALMSGIPNLNVFCPSDLNDMMLGMEKVLKSDEPFYIRFNDFESEIVHSDEFEIGKAEILTEGKDIAIITYGFLVNEAFKTVNLLKKQGINTTLINLRTIKPLDKEAIIDSIKETNYTFILEDHFVDTGLFSIISNLLVKENIYEKIFPIGLESKWFKPLLLNDLLKFEKFDSEGIKNRILNILCEFY